MEHERQFAFMNVGSGSSLDWASHLNGIMKKRILLLGYLGFRSNPMDGQTIKTRQVYELIRKNIGDKVHLKYFDTEDLHSNPFRIFVLLFRLMRTSKVVYMPAHNNLRLFYPPLVFLSRLFHYDILYVLIGGWLPVFIEKYPYLLPCLRKTKFIFPESPLVTDCLREKYALANTCTFPNFRFRTGIEKPATRKNPSAFRLVFMSRIMKMKGIEVVFALADRFLTENDKGCSVEIDFYGKVYAEDQVYFDQEVARLGNVRYLGGLDPDRINSVLQEYDALILPTRFPTECVPGAVVDAYMAGIPVLVSNWLYARDCVDDGETGFIVPIGKGEVESYEQHVRFWISHPGELGRMKEAAYAKSFTLGGDEQAWGILSPFLDEEVVHGRTAR